MSPEIPRENLIATLETLTSTEVRVLVLEGAEGTGKSTLLRQFRDHLGPKAILLEISGASRWGYDPGVIMADLYHKVHKSILGTEPSPDTELEKELGRIVVRANREAMAKGETLFVLVDGLAEVPLADSPAVEAILEFLPLDQRGFRVIMAGVANDIPFKSTTRLSLKTFTVPFFTREECERFMEGLSLTRSEMDSVYVATRGLPAQLASIRRAIVSAKDPRAVLSQIPTETSEAFAFEWKTTAVLTEEVLVALAILAADSKPIEVNALADLIGSTPDTLTTTLRGLGFLVWEDDCVDYVTEAFRRFAEGQLVAYNERAHGALIESLLNDPDSEDAIARLPGYFTRSSRSSDLLQYLSPSRFALLYKRSPSLKAVQQRAQDAIDAAKEVRSDGDLLRFSLQKSAIEELARSSGVLAEVRARTVIGEYDVAVGMANASPRDDLRFKLLAVIARARIEYGFERDPQLEAELRRLFRGLEPDAFGKEVGEIASDLLYVAPDLAIELVSRSSGDQDNAIDFALAGLSLQALFSRSNPDIASASAAARKRISLPAAMTLATNAAVILGKFSVSEIMGVIGGISSVGDQLYILQHWMLSNRASPRAHELLELGLKTAINATGFTANAGVYRQLASCLPFLKEYQRVAYYVGLIDAQREVLAHLGPPPEFVELQLLLAEAVWHFDEIAGETRFAECYNVLSTMTDLSQKAVALVSLGAALERCDPKGRTEEDLGLATIVEDDLTKVIKALLFYTADHFEATRAVVSRAATASPDLALAICRSLNTQPRRDEAFRLFASSNMRLPSGRIAPANIVTAVSSIDDSEIRDDAAVAVLGAMVKKVRREAAKPKGLMSLVGLAESIHDTVLKARGLGMATEWMAIVEGGVPSDRLKALRETCREAWEAIDEGWEKRSVALDLAVNMAQGSHDDARFYVHEANRLAETLVLVDEEATLTATLSIQLAIRAFGGLLSRGSSLPEELNRILVAIGNTGSLVNQIALLSELAVRAKLARNDKVCQEVVQGPLKDKLLAYDRRDQGGWEQAVAIALPALYHGAPALYQARLSELSSARRDNALGSLLFTIKGKVTDNDPYEGRHGIGFDMNYAEAVSILTIARDHESDGELFYAMRDVVDSIVGQFGNNFKRSQKADLILQMRNLIATRFPNPKYITHEGYIIASEAYLNRALEKSERVDVQKLIERGRKLPNAADQAYVLGLIASTVPGRKERNALVAEIRAIIDRIPMKVDQVDHYESLSIWLADVDQQMSKDLLKHAFNVATGASEPGITERRRTIIELAFRMYPDAVGSIVSITDDDPGKRRLDAEVRAQKLKTALTVRKQADTAVVSDAKDLARAAWLSLAALNGKKIAPLPPERCLARVEVASRLGLVAGYSVFAWFIENAVRQTRGDRAVREYVAPMLEACLYTAEMAVAVSGRTRSLGAVDARRAIIVETEESGLLLLEERQKAKESLTRWIADVRPEELVVIDPYFPPSNVELLAIVTDNIGDIAITVLAGYAESLRDGPGQPEHRYREHWSKLRADEPPFARIILVRERVSGKCPFHDRAWVTNSGEGLSLGPSYNGVGVRFGVGQLLAKHECEQLMARLGGFVNQTAREYKGERLDYLSFNL